MKREDIIESLNEALKTIDTRMNELNSYTEKFETFSNFKESSKVLITEEDYNIAKSKFDEVDKEFIVENISGIKKAIVNYTEEIEKNYSNYNINYLRHIFNYAKSIIRIFNKNIPQIYFNTEPNYFVKQYIDYVKNISAISKGKDILELFSNKEKRNYVIFGKNGSGKTRLLNHIKQDYISSNSYVIPSNRIIEFEDNNISKNEASQINLENLFTNHSRNPNDILTIKLDSIDHLELSNGKSKKEEDENQLVGETLLKVTNIFNSLGLNRKIMLNKEIPMLMLYNNEKSISKYSISNGSDGEKSIIQIIMFVILCPKDSFIFIDEPENHLNSALLNELFSSLEKERDDLVFIYCTHNKEFIESRTNCDLIFLNSFNGIDWEVETMSSYEEIPLDVITSIIGTKKQLLFIESEKNKRDYKLYSCLFDEYKVIPYESCSKVEEICKSINNNHRLFERKACGIVDNDYKTKDEIEKLKKSNIFVLKYNEIENILLSDLVIEYYINNISGCPNKLNELKEKVIEIANQNRNGIIQSFINKIQSRLEKKTKYKYNGNQNDLENKLDETYKNNKQDFLKELENFINNLDDMIKTKNYENIVKNISDKGFTLAIKQVLGIEVDSFLNTIINYLNKDEKFKKELREEIFSEKLY